MHNHWFHHRTGDRLRSRLRTHPPCIALPAAHLTHCPRFQIRVKYQYVPGNIWRNIGILWAMYVIYTIMVIIGSMLLIRDTGVTTFLL